MDPTDTSAPTQVGDYALVRRIGAGGMGEVWLGRHVVSGSLGAVKRLAPRARGRAPLGTYFEREGRAVARLAHPHVVPLFAIGDDYLVSAFIDGPNLSRRLHTPIAPAEALRLVRQVADALGHAHERGIIHRDVKPSNILLDEHGNAFLADFGLAAFVGEDDDPARRAGTPQFMAPEQRTGGAVGPAADQYALGRTLLEMLVGSGVPLDAAAALAELPVYLPPALASVIGRATAADPAARFPSMAAFAEALSALELDAVGAPQRLAPVVRDAAPFGWLAGAWRVESVGPDLQRADLRLGELADRGLLRPEWVAALRRETGLADIGFSLWVATARLGPASDPLVLARASDAVVLLHGWGSTRTVWSDVARGVCRDNARAVVLAPDVHGFGESSFAGMPTFAQAGALGMARAVDAWRRILGLGDIPTALVGHSMTGLALLTIDDDDAGQQVSRVAINPTLVGHQARLRWQLRAGAVLAATLGRFPAVRRALLRWSARNDPETRRLAPEFVAMVTEQLLRMPSAVMARILRALAATPAHFGRHRRAALMATVDDTWMDPRVRTRAALELGMASTQVHLLPSGGHLPHVESANEPAGRARNVADIVRLIDSMLVTASVPSLASVSPSLVGPTVSAGSSTGY
jgi:hypothetical protein